MALITLNPKSTNMLIADYAKLSNKFLLVIDNSKYHTLSADKKATVLAYYDDIIPEAEIDRIFELEHIYYYFDRELDQQMLHLIGFHSHRMYQTQIII